LTLKAALQLDDMNNACCTADELNGMGVYSK